MKYLKIYEDFRLSPNVEANRLTRITTDTYDPNFKDIKENDCFVFGSNLQGVHTRGSGRFAISKGWADENQISGPSSNGKSYAIPTQNNRIDLPLEEIKKHVDEFLDFADKNQNTNFLVTMLGTGTVGYKIEQIAPLFKRAEEIVNICLPKEFWDNILYEAY
jgi:hypothetical protein